MPSRTTRTAQDAILSGQLLDLVAAGQTIAAAGRQLQIPERRAQRLYHREIQRYYEDNMTLRQELVGREMRTLDLLQRAVIKDALAGDLRAVDRVLAIQTQRAKFADLFAATRVEIEVTRVDDALANIVKMIDGELVAATPLQRVISVGA